MQTAGRVKGQPEIQFELHDRTIEWRNRSQDVWTRNQAYPEKQSTALKKEMDRCVSYEMQLQFVLEASYCLFTSGMTGYHEELKGPSMFSCG